MFSFFYIRQEDYRSFSVPACSQCGGIMMPTVVFFGTLQKKSQQQRALDDERAYKAMYASVLLRNDEKERKRASERASERERVCVCERVRNEDNPVV